MISTPKPYVLSLLLYIILECHNLPSSLAVNLQCISIYLFFFIALIWLVVFFWETNSSSIHSAKVSVSHPSPTSPSRVAMWPTANHHIPSPWLQGLIRDRYRTQVELTLLLDLEHSEAWTEYFDIKFILATVREETVPFFLLPKHPKLLWLPPFLKPGCSVVPLTLWATPHSSNKFCLLVLQTFC